MKHRILLVACAAALFGVHGAAQVSLRFSDAGNGSYSFDTGVLSGCLRSDGKSVGLLPVTLVENGEVLTRSMGFAGHYRVFAGAQRFGAGAWYWPSTSKLLQDGSVETTWAAAADRPFELSAVYKWADTALLDVITRVRADIKLPDFETFLAFYFNDRFTESAVLGQGQLMAAEQIEGAWQMFPRDAAATRLIADGRWKIPPNPVDWTIRPSFARPVGIRRAASDGLTAVMMCSECFAVSTPHGAEGHYSMYLSLFGRTLEQGEVALARARMAVLRSPNLAKIEQVWSEFSRSPAPPRTAR